MLTTWLEDEDENSSRAFQDVWLVASTRIVHQRSGIAADCFSTSNGVFGSGNGNGNVHESCNVDHGNSEHSVTSY